MARRLAGMIAGFAGAEVAVAGIDIGPYRDDQPIRADPAATTDPRPGVDGRTVILVDDVMHTGRTIRAALEAVLHCGRPARVRVAVLVDRGHRELPIRPDHVGKNLPTSNGERVSVQLLETDGRDGVFLLPVAANAGAAG